MGHPSHAPARNAACDLAEQDEVERRPRPALRLSRRPLPSATIVQPIAMPIVEETFRSLGTEPPGPPDNDTLTEDELFAIWSARLL
jgi:hypothetical protein